MATNSRPSRRHFPGGAGGATVPTVPTDQKENHPMNDQAKDTGPVDYRGVEVPDPNGIPYAAKSVLYFLDEARRQRPELDVDDANLVAADVIDEFCDAYATRRVDHHAAEHGKAHVAHHEHEYVRAINAVLACPDDSSPDAHRWRGHAEAHRYTVTRLRDFYGMPQARLTTEEWRAANGVYSAEQVHQWRTEQYRERKAEQRDVSTDVDYEGLHYEAGTVADLHAAASGATRWENVTRAQFDALVQLRDAIPALLAAARGES